MDVDRLRDGVDRQLQPHGVGHFLNQYGGVGAEDVCPQYLPGLPVGQNFDEAVPVLDGRAVSRIVIVVGCASEETSKPEPEPITIKSNLFMTMYLSPALLRALY